MKITADGTAYGSAIELNPVEHRKGAWVTVHLPDGTAHRVLRATRGLETPDCVPVSACS